MLTSLSWAVTVTGITRRGPPPIGQESGLPNPGSQTVFAKTHRTTASVFGEVIVPLISEANSLPFVNGFSLDVSGRHDDYSDFGTTDNYKIGFTWDPFEVAMAKLSRGQPTDAPIPEDSFVVKLLGSRIPPPWLRALPFTLPEHSALAGEQIRIWEVTPDQSPAEAAAHAANYYLETGKPDPGGQITAALAEFPRDLSANVMLAGLQSRQQDAAAFTATLRRILGQLPDAGALSLEDQIHLTVVLAVAQQLELAQTQLQAAMAKVNETSLRRLTPGTLSDLLSLSDGLRVPLPTPSMQQLARQLVPPLQRK